MSESIYTFLILALLIPLIVITVYFLKKIMVKTISIDKKIEIKAQLQIGTKERILLVNAQGKSFLIGATPQAIHTLHVFEQSQGLQQHHPQWAEPQKPPSLGESVHV